MSVKRKASSPTTLLSQINSDYLTCQICMDTYKQPKVLKCQHTFCRSCLEACAATDSGSYMPCPVCRQKTLLGMKGVAGLKDNFAFSSMIDMLDTWNKSKTSTSKSAEFPDGRNPECSTCPSDDQAVATHQCLDCFENFCKNCAAFHQRTKLTKDHEVVLIEDIQNGLHEEKIRWREQSICKQHEAMMMHYCSSCEEPACKDCIIEKHQSHELESIEDAAAKRKQMVAQLELDLKAGANQLQTHLAEMESRKVRETTKLEKYRKDITDHTEQIRLLLVKKEDVLLEELGKIETENSSKINGCIDRLCTQRKCIDNCVQLSSHILKANVPYEILSMHRQIQDTAKHLKSKNSDVMKRNMDDTKTLTGVRIQLSKLKQFDIALATIDQECTNDMPAKAPDLVSPPDQPKVAPRRVAPRAKKPPRPANRSTHLITAKELETLDKAIKSSSTSLNIEQHRLSLQEDDLVRTKSLECIPQSVTDAPVESKQTQQQPSKGTVPTRKPRAPRPPIPHPPSTSLPTPPPQSKKPLLLKSEPLPLRGVLCAKFGKKGKIVTNGEFVGPPQHVIFSKTKFKILALDAENKHILVFSGDGIFKKSFRVAFSDLSLKAVAIAESGKKHVLVLYKKFITQWSWDGRLLCKWGEADVVCANCITTDSQGRILVSDQEKHTIFIYDPTTKEKLNQIGGYGDGECLFKSPRYICTSKTDNILVSDHHNHCIKVFRKNGTFLIKCGSKGSFDGELKYPEGIDTVTLADGSEGIVVADEGNSRISLFTSDGRFLGHILTKVDDKNLKSPNTVSISHTGQEMVVKQANQIGLKVYKLSTVGG